LIIDSCFAASLYRVFMGSGGPVGVAGVKLKTAFADSGTALLCASGPRDPAKAPEGMNYTMFTGALVDVLRKGDESAPAILSLQDIAYLVKRSIAARFKGEAVLPEIHAPDQTRGRVDTVPIFPNPRSRRVKGGRRAKTAERTVDAKRWAGRAEAARQAEEEKRRAEAARQAEEERQRAEAARQAEERRRAEEEKQRAEVAQQAEEENQRAEAARQAEEEKKRAEAARRAEEKNRQAEAARLAAEERQRTEATRLATEEERQRAEAARHVEEQNRRTEAARQAKRASVDLAAADWRTRWSAVITLTHQTRETDTIVAEAARRALQSHLQHERDDFIRASIIEALPKDETRLAIEEKQQAEGARHVEEGERAEPTRQAEEERQPAEVAHQTDEEKKEAWAEGEQRRAEQRSWVEGQPTRKQHERVESAQETMRAARRFLSWSHEEAERARQAEEEKRRTEVARRAEEEKQRDEVERQAEEERQRAKAARQAVEEKQRAEAARVAEEKKRRDEAEWRRWREENERDDEEARQAKKRKAEGRGRLTPPELVVVPAGEFLMGSPDWEEGSYEDERPQHRVAIARRFAIGRLPVTFDEYDWFCEATGHREAYDPGWGRGRRQPVVEVSWDDAQAYLAWLSQETGQAYRLPSEAEWEYACRAGTTTRFSVGDTITTEDANYRDSGSGRTSEVGIFPSNPWGLHDMHGNVLEWVEDDWHQNYQGAPRDGSAWKDKGPYQDLREHVLRGGSWYGLSTNCRSAFRVKHATYVTANYIGFRVARTLSS